MLHEVCLSFLILTACTMNGTSLKSTIAFDNFSSLLFSNGSARCILDAPTMFLLSRSAISCGAKCINKPLCSFYNYISATKGCQLFCFSVIRFGISKSCRSYRLNGVTPAENFLSLTADDVILALFFDGFQVDAAALPNASIWDVPDKVALPSMVSVIAAYVQNTNPPGYGGLLASDSSGRILSDSSWLCSTVTSSGWMNVNFDDSTWKSASVLFNNSGKVTTIYPSIPGMHPDAWWIWNTEKSMDYYVYFRLHLS